MNISRKDAKALRDHLRLSGFARGILTTASCNGRETIINSLSTSDRLLTVFRLSANAESAALEQGFYFFACHPSEVPGDGMLEGAHGHSPIQAFLQIAVEQTVNQAGRERIPGAQAIDNLHLIGSRMEDFISPAGNGSPLILPYQRIFTKGNGHDLNWKSP